MKRAWPLLFLCSWLQLSVPSPADETVRFADQIAPILQQHCVRCHSPGNAKGDLSLATIDGLLENEYLIPGDPDASHLIDVVSGSDDEPPEMPQDGEPLDGDQVTLLRRWIAQGAKWPADVVLREKSRANQTWWSLQPLGEFHPGEKTIDDFVQAKLAEQGLTLNPPAERRDLIRRATFDLLGLPPTPEEVQAFINDTDPRAYENLIERLLASPHYGERWGRHWLDVVRYGESIGYERNVIINNIWPFRDYVIRSINEDKPFDQLIREHLAGDVIDHDDPQTVVGSAFLVAGPYDDVGNQDAAQAAQIRANTLDEIIRATSEAFLGMTVGCARCHDHKFDPITQRDYYGLYATFSGIRHGSVVLATPEAKADRQRQIEPLNRRQADLVKALAGIRKSVLARAEAQRDELEAAWTRPPVDRTGTEERFSPVRAKFVRLICEAQDVNVESATGFGIDEFEIWSAEEPSRNVALAVNGGTAMGEARKIEDFPGAYGPHLAIDGETGARFIAAGTQLTIELARLTVIDRIVFSSAKGQDTPQQGKFVFVAEYRIEVSEDGQVWQEIAHGRDRQPVPRDAYYHRRFVELVITPEERQQQQALARELAEINDQLQRVPPLPHVWIGTRVAEDAQGPFHVFLGGSPQKPGDEINPASLSVFDQMHHGEIDDWDGFGYELSSAAPEAARRLALANWIVARENPLTPRVLANRVWHYHFGTGIVATPSDFGYMGSPPSHPQLLDFLARRLLENEWRLKPIHRFIMMSKTYRQSSAHRADAASVDGDARYLWRFPPRRLSAEEIRDTILQVSGKLQRRSWFASSGDPTPDSVPDGGPGFRLYHFMQDNVCTYAPLDRHGPETYRRAVYHQNARASVVDLMTDFDQPDCTFTAPRRAETTTPLQALTMLNHQFTLDMAKAFAERLSDDAGDEVDAQITRAFELCFGRRPTPSEDADCRQLIDRYGMPALCRVLLNTSEMIYVR